MFRALVILRHVVKYGAILVLLLVFLAHSLVLGSSSDRVFARAEELPPGISTAVVLGTSPYTRGGRPNRFFSARIDAAARLVRSGTVAVVVVSGDNAHHSYNEPAAMTAALEDRGLEAHQIVQDYAGFRTLDSMVRMREVFGQQRFVVVSQRFHVERAVFVARARGIDAYGYVAADAGGLAQLSVRLREYAARVRAILDVYIFHTAPRFLGDPIPIEVPEGSSLQSDL